ncbi:nucleotidyltransferase domain-containing protein [Advenella sp. FME57]|uniref:Transcriptional regulator n=1 Tax=Advenella kashmirensis TaxID=310575 RepID=A0A356LB21_9BURK|nr:nucleotidyltransferase domain-containing protein [Advenella sp. FME57]HBP28210.1 transcriptional regulator [Advenella kashmirensis]
MPNMGIPTSSSRPSVSLANALFSSTKQQVLRILFGQPDRSFYANEIINLASSGSGAVQRELATLADSGLVTATRRGNQKHYQANQHSPIFGELRAIVQKTIGVAEPIRNALAPLAPHIAAAFIYGSIAKKTDTATSDVDLMLLSDSISYGEAYAALEEASHAIGRPVNPTILTQAEFAKRMAAKESFLTRVLAQPKIWIIGADDALPV